MKAPLPDGAPPSPYRSRLGWLAAALAAVGVVLAPAASPDTTLGRFDTDVLYGSLRGLVDHALRAGRLPLWNPHEGLGKPLFAEGIHAVLHPVSLLVAALRPGSVDALIVLYALLAAAGAFVLATALRASPAAAFATATIYALSGFNLSMSGNLVFLGGAATAPWIVAALLRAGDGDRRTIAWAGLAVAAGFLSGDVQATAVAAALGAALALARHGRSALLAVLAAVGCGVLVGAVQIAPSLWLLRTTTRGLPISAAEAARWPFEPWRLPELVAPGLFTPLAGTRRAPVYLAVTGVGGFLAPFAPSVYVGAASVALAAIAVRRRGEALVLASATVLLLWLAMGDRAGASALTSHLPVWNRFRYPEKLVGPATLALAALAGLGVDALRGAGRRTAIGVAAATALVLLVALPLGSGLVAPGALDPAAADQVAGAARAGALHLALGIAGLGAAWALRAARPGLSAALAAFTPAACLLAASPLAVHAGDARLREPTLLPAVPPDAPAARVGTPERLEAPDATSALDATDSYALAWSTQLVAPYNARVGVDQVASYGAFASRRYTTVVDALGEQRRTAFRRYAMTHLSLIRPESRGGPPAAPGESGRFDAAIAGGRLEAAHPTVPADLWALPHRPWAFVPDQVIVRASPEDALAVLVQLARAGDPGVVVEAPHALPGAPGRILASERAPERVRIEAELAGDGLVVVADAYWPGWTATVDGRAAPIYPADVLVRAIPVPAGRHVIELAYRPPEVLGGAAVSAAGLIAVAALGWPRRRRAPAT